MNNDVIDVIIWCTIIIVILCIAVVALISAFDDNDEFGTVICKERHTSLGVCSRFGCSLSHTEYYLIDENDNSREISFEIYDSLIAIPECNAIE